MITRRQKKRMWDKERIKRLREECYGESREQFARRLHVVLGTLRNWEQGLNSPIGPAEALLDRLQEDYERGEIRDLQSA